MKAAPGSGCLLCWYENTMPNIYRGVKGGVLKVHYGRVEALLRQGQSVVN